MAARWKVVAEYSTVMQVRARLHLIPMALGGLVAGLEMAALGLIAPLMAGLARGSYDDVWGWPGFRWLFASLSSWPAYRSAPLRFSFLFLVLCFLGLIILQRVSQFGLALYRARRDVIYRRRARTHTFARFLRFGKLFFDRRSQGVVDEYLTASDAVLTMLVSLEGGVLTGLRLLARVAVLFGISVQLGLLGMLGLPLLLVLHRKLLPRVQRVSRELNDELLHQRRRIFSMLAAIPLVKSCGREETCRQQYQQLQDDFGALKYRQAFWAGMLFPLEASLLLVGVAGLTFVGATWLSSGAAADLSKLCAFLLVAQLTIQPITNLSGLLTRWASLFPRLDMLVECHQDADKHILPSGARALTPLRQGISVVDLDFSYDEDSAVFAQLNLEVVAGRTTALVGPSGCGKTTLLSLLARLYEAPAGAVRFDGVDIQELDQRSFSRQVAMVAQDPWLFAGTLRENLCFGVDGTVEEDKLREVCQLCGLDELLRGMPAGLDTRIGDHGVRLSGGQRQRLGLARALLSDPSILLLDEATSGLDADAEAQLQQNLRARLKGRTALWVSHRLSSLRLADRVVVLAADGTVAQQGSWDDVLAREGPLRQLHRLQTAGWA